MTVQRVSFRKEESKIFCVENKTWESLLELEKREIIESFRFQDQDQDNKIHW